MFPLAATDPAVPSSSPQAPMPPQHQRHGAHQRVVLSEPADDDPDALRFRNVLTFDQRMPLIGRGQRIDQQRPRQRAPAADDDQAGVDDRADHAEAAAGNFGGVGDQPDAADVAGDRQGDELLDRNRAPQQPRGDLDRRIEARGQLETASIAASAEIPGGVYRHMAELAAAAGDPGQHAAVADDRAADADVDLEQHEILDPDRGAPGHLGDRRAIAFVVGEDRPLERGLENVPDIHARPSRDDAGALNPAVGRDRARNRDSHPQQAAQRQTEALVSLAYRPPNRRRRRSGRIIAIQRDSIFGNDRMRY